MTDDGAFLSELVALLGDPDDLELQTADEVGALHVSAAKQAKAPGSGIKVSVGDRSDSGDRGRFVEVSTHEGGNGQTTIDALRSEVDALTRQLEQLRTGKMTVVESAMMERRRREKAEHECQILREAVYRQTQFIRGLRTVFSATPHFSLALDLCRYLHRHTRLSRNRSARWIEYESQGYDARIQVAMEVLCRETAAIPLAVAASEPFVNCELIDDTDRHSVTATTIYTLETPDIGAVVRAACVAIRDIVAICPFGHPLTVSRDILDTDALPSKNILYRVMDVRHCCPNSGEDLFIESHVITTYKVTPEYAVVLWDFVDDDELHPTPDMTNITREITGACLIRRERCHDGIERTVFRSLSTKKFRFHGQLSRGTLDKFVCVGQPVPMVRVDELLFRQIVLEQIAAEEAAYARAQIIRAGAS